MQEKSMYSRPQKFTRHRFAKELAKSRHIASNPKFLSVVAGAWNPRGVSFWGRVHGHATVLPRKENSEQFGKTKIDLLFPRNNRTKNTKANTL